MKKISKRIIIAIMTCLMLFVCISCDNEAKKYEKMRAELETVVSSVPIKTTEDLSFPKKVGDYEVTWTSSNEKVISNEGVVTRQDEDVTVKITIKITNGELSVIEEVTIVVPKKEQIEEKPILSFEKVQYEVKVDEKITLNPTIKNAKGNEKVVYEYDNEYLSCENNTFTALKEGEVVIRAFLEGTSEKIEIKVTISPKDTSKPEVKTIAEVLNSEDGSYIVEGGTIIATYARGFLIDDTTGKILVFLGQEFDGSIKVGDTVKVQGSTSVYGLMKQFGLDTTVEKTGEGAVDQPTATEIDGAKLDEFADLTEAQVQYVKMTGKLTVSGNYFNLEVSGASKVTGSITYPQDQEALNALAGKNIEVTGYFIGVTGSSKKYANIMVTEFKEVGGSVIEPEPEPITGDVVLDFVKNFGTYAGSWSTSYEPKTITGKDLGLNNNIKVVISIANKQKDDQPIADRPVIAVGKKGIEQTVVVSGFEGKLKDVTFNLKQWNEKKKFDSIIIEYSEDGTTWTKASDDAISG
ncbi:MAG: immunoglobulin-like domain-containing protein, partial [Bacilli bacterium]|nr:immunoglobulin-like domain-containing protein [Bacilli bacterium]